MSESIKATAALIHTQVTKRCKKFPYGAALEIAHQINGIQSSNHKASKQEKKDGAFDMEQLLLSIENACSALRDAQHVVDPYLPGSDEYSQLIEMSDAGNEEEAVDRGHTGAYMFEIYALEHAARNLQKIAA